MPDWTSTTHDWRETVDVEHLAQIRSRWREYAPTGALHLLLEVLAYAADEAAALGGGHCQVTLHADGSATVADDGRGTDTRLDENGAAVRKPVMCTQDLRFFAAPEPPDLPDGHPRRGISVVAALSEHLVHGNRRRDGAWSQSYARGVPVGDLAPVAPDGTTGTTVRFTPADEVRPALADVTEAHLALLHSWPDLAVEVTDLRRVA